jgi:hypothetical protein
MRAVLATCFVLASAPAIAQPDAGGQPLSQNGAEAVNGADQVVGLFGAACLQFAGNAQATRKFLTDQHAPQMPPQARDAFLAGRTGEAFDTSYQSVKLALVSLDDGACEAVVEQANPQEVLATLQQAAQENHVPLTSLGTQADKTRQAVQHSAYSLTIDGKTMHVLVSTASAPPQAVLTLVPR